MADRKLWAVIRREFLERVRSKWFVIGTLFGPLLFGTLMALPAVMARRDTERAANARITIVDATGTSLGRQVVAQLAGGIAGSTAEAPLLDSIGAGAMPDAVRRAEAQVIDGTVVGYLVLDSATLERGAAKYAGSNTTTRLAMQRIERAVQRELLALRIAQSNIDPVVGQRLATTSVSMDVEQLSKKGRGGSGKLNFLFGFAVAMLLYIMVFIYGLNVLRGVLEEKQTRVAEVVIASISPARLLIGKVIGVGGVGLVQMLFWISTSVGLYRLREPLLARFGIDAAPMTIPGITALQVVILLAFFIVGFTLYAGLFAAAGATVSSEQEAQQAQMPIVLLLVSSITFAQNILMQPDGSLSRVLSMLPHSAPIIMPIRMTVSYVPATDLAVALLSVTGGAILSIWGASRIYRVGLLMYGKRPGFREIITWMRRR